ncbi:MULTISPECIES: Imm45 family immunity protein [unclassified Pseudomonas]|uniref:Imm45 family immunity protein n=1 Tax=unclassified Pseudomonas TaxID=196821 RepID=UPI001064D27B|nr:MULTISPECIES: Imm45 family immunity protein [unclassified Pseudomonas]MCE5981681.1 immunity 45 family protein [Pseudomonas sp. LF19]
MTKLLECSSEVFSCGTVFRARGSYPYEEVVDFMVFNTLDEDRCFGLMVTTGYKAGLPLVWLPGESNAGCLGLSREWVLANWGKWIYPDCEISQVLVIDGYKPGSHVELFE